MLADRIGHGLGHLHLLGALAKMRLRSRHGPVWPECSGHEIIQWHEGQGTHEGMALIIMASQPPQPSQGGSTPCRIP